jgi:hypothetical protein
MICFSGSIEASVDRFLCKVVVYFAEGVQMHRSWTSGGVGGLGVLANFF